MKSYKASDNVQITAHFNSREFLCKCSSNHAISLNENLVDMLEKLYSGLNCGKIIITSGVRCATYSVAVGGYATDEHVKGNAADIVCYDKNNNIISSKIVCCAAQDIGFKGIGRISDTATHVDVSTTRTWKGDETTGTNNTVTSDFYSYYRLSKSDVYKTVENVEKSVELLINGKSVYKGVIK